MLMIEVVANSLMVLIALVLGMLLFNRLLQRAVEMSFAKTARVEASRLDDELRHLDNND